MKIRNANVDDTKVLYGLYDFILSLRIDLIKKIGKEKLFEILKECFESSEDRYSYKNCMVVEKENDIKAFSFSYNYEFLLKSKVYWDSNIVIKYNLDSRDVIFEYNEVLKDEYYLDILYVFDDSRSQGYGTELLKDFFEKDFRIKSLNVAEDNPRARKLYESFDMKEEGELIIANHTYKHMVHRL